MSPIRFILYGFLLSFCFSKSFAQDLSLSSPDKNLTIKLSLDQGKLYYHVLLDTNSEPKIKISTVRYQANELICKFENPNKNQLEVVFRVSNNDIAFRYQVPQTGEPANLTIEEELTGYNFPEATTTFLTPQASPMIGWMKTKPSYEEEYTTDQAMGVKPVVETTIPFDVVEPQYTASKDYSFGRSTWSWLLWQDDSIDFDDQKICLVKRLPCTQISMINSHR